MEAADVERKEGAEPEENTTLSNTEVTTKYQEAAKIVNSTLAEIVALAVPGASVLAICRSGDESITRKCELIYRAKKGGKVIEKGIAFPVCISVNECVCHYSPLSSEDTKFLAAGDMVKIDFGVHVDGYIAVAAHTIVVPSADPAVVAAPITGVQADVVNAAYTAAEVAARLIKVGNTNKQVTEALSKVAAAYGVTPIMGTMSHQMKRYVIDGSKMILLVEDDVQKAEPCTFEPYEVYAVDIAMSSGEGKPREIDTRTTVFKRMVDKTYNLKIKASRTFLSEVNSKFPIFPFSLRSFEDERAAKMGVRECVSHELVQPYQVLYERPGSYICHVKFTVLLLPGGTSKITGLEVTPGQFVSEGKTLHEDTVAILATEIKKKSKKSKGKKASADEEA